MKTVLKCSMPVHRVAVFAEMAWLARRPELGLLCRAAREHERCITVETVQSVLPGLSEAGAENIVGWCQMLGLCDSSGLLEPRGDAAANSDEAPVPEQGIFELCIVEHPLIGARVLHAERLSSTRDARWEVVKPLPIVPDFGRIFVSAVDPKERFIVRALPANHGEKRCIVKPSNAECGINWTLDFDQGTERWRLEGSLGVSNGRGQERKQFVTAQESGGVDLRAIAAVWGEGPLSEFGTWREREQHLEVAIDGLSSEEIESFRKTFELESVEVQGKGSFDDVRIEDVPIAPRSASEAARWALERLFNRFSQRQRYRSRRDVRNDFTALTEDNPLSRHMPRLPSHGDLLEKSERLIDQYWALAAPVDLAPEPPAAAELESVAFGATNAPWTTDASSEFEIRPSETTSMRKVVERLLAGVAPHRVLVCDRHVKGEDNLNSLKLLIDALRASANEVSVDVWTLVDRNDASRIQGIVKTMPQDLGERFARRPPHDRYFLVSGQNGESVAWRMTHSLLHARARGSASTQDSPLKWNDLYARRRDPEQLEAPLRGWLNGGAR